VTERVKTPTYVSFNPLSPKFSVNQSHNAKLPFPDAKINRK